MRMKGNGREGKGKTVIVVLFGEPAGFVTEVAELEIHRFSTHSVSAAWSLARHISRASDNMLHARLGDDDFRTRQASFKLPLEPCHRAVIAVDEENFLGFHAHREVGDGIPRGVAGEIKDAHFAV